MFYVYEWYRSDLNLPYYIGKGKEKRAYDLKRNKHTDVVTRYLSKNGIRRDVRIIAYFKTEEAAFDFEIERIAFWWHLKDHEILTNQTMGGEGAASGDLNPQKRSEARKRVSIQMSGDRNPMKNPEYVKKISGENHYLHNNVEYAKWFSENNPMKNPEISAKLTGDKNPSKRPDVMAKLRKPRTEEGRQKILEAQQRRRQKEKELGIKFGGWKNPASSIATTLRWAKWRAEKAARLLTGDE